MQALNEGIWDLIRHSISPSIPNAAEIFANKLSITLAERLGDRRYASRIQTALLALGDYTFLEVSDRSTSKRIPIINHNEALTCLQTAFKKTKRSDFISALQSESLQYTLTNGLERFVAV